MSFAYFFPFFAASTNAKERRSMGIKKKKRICSFSVRKYNLFEICKYFAKDKVKENDKACAKRQIRNGIIIKVNKIL